MKHAFCAIFIFQTRSNALSFCLNELPLLKKCAILFQKKGDFTKI